MPAIGPFEKVSFTTYAHIRAGDAGSVVIATGTDDAAGAEFVFGADGSLSTGGVAFTKVGGSTTPVEPSDPDQPTTPSLPSVPAWTRPELLNGWSQRAWSPSAPSEAIGCRVVGHRVELTGSLEGITVTAKAGETCVIFLLPVGARPLVGFKTLLVLAQGNTVGTLKVYPDGQVVYAAGSLAGEVSLHGVYFTLD